MLYHAYFATCPESFGRKKLIITKKKVALRGFDNREYSRSKNQYPNLSHISYTPKQHNIKAYKRKTTITNVIRHQVVNPLAT